MRVVLRVTSDADSGRQVWLRPGQSIRIGRTELADFAFPNDGELAEEHFAIEFSADQCWLRDLNSDGTFVNGKRILGRAELDHGDTVAAGNTTFELMIEGTPAIAKELSVPKLELPPEAFKERLYEYFRNLTEPLFAIFDAARDPLALTLLIQSDHEYQSLYEGIKGEQLAAVAPYLVKIRSDSQLLQTLIDKGWGENWGVYLTCNKPFKEVRKHLRKFLLVQTPEHKQVYFRFYDPRVLRVFLPTCTPDEAADFFGPIRSYFCATEDPADAIEFAADRNGASDRMKLTTDHPIKA